MKQHAKKTYAHIVALDINQLSPHEALETSILARSAFAVLDGKEANTCERIMYEACERFTVACPDYMLLSLFEACKDSTDSVVLAAYNAINRPAKSKKS